MDLKLIQRLIQIMKKGGLGELELEDQKEGLRVRLKRGAEGAAPAPLVHLMHAPAAAGAHHAPAPGSVPAAASEAAAGGAHTIASPMVGTFYRTPSPEAEPFVRVGSRIEVDKTLCIIEAMKVMNEIKSEIAGEILEILVENGEPVEFGQPLFLIKSS